MPNRICRTIKEMILVLFFLAFCNYWNADTKFLANFFLSSFVCPMIRVAFPQQNRGYVADAHELRYAGSRHGVSSFLRCRNCAQLCARTRAACAAVIPGCSTGRSLLCSSGGRRWC